MRSDNPSEQETYIGDGVYASFDGCMIKLRTERDGRNEIIFLEPEVYDSLAIYAARCWRPD